jgi:ferredoxin--NADP+ reductase
LYKILEKKVLAEGIKLLVVKAPMVAKYCQPGQFIILRVDEKGERIPLTIYDYSREKGTVAIIFQEVGKTTFQLGKMEVGNFLIDFVGPLGLPFEKEITPEEIKEAICVGGGVGAAPIYPKIKWLKEKGIKVTTILGAKSKNLVILEEEIKKISDEVYLYTDDGTYGEKGFVTEGLKRQLATRRPDLVIAIGPLPMMKVAAEITKPFQVRTLVSLNSIMVDGTGMCGSCRVTVGDEVKFTCSDGPTFDGHLVDFEELQLRQVRFLPEEKISLRVYEKRGGHQCQL